MERSVNGRADMIAEMLEKFNNANHNLKRFKIFNTFTFSYEQNGAYFTIDVANDDGGLVENTMTLMKTDADNFLVINLENDKEFLWVLKTIDRFIKRTEELTLKAREIAKPQVGILIYDEFSDSYLLNSTTGAVLLKTKAVMKQISATKIDLTSVLFNMRNALTERDFAGEIIGERAEKIIAIMQHIAQSINADSTQRIALVERIPRVHVEFEVNDTMLRIKSYVTDKFDDEDRFAKVVNEESFSARATSVAELDGVYNKLRSAQVLNDHMKKLARILIGRNNPKLYIQYENKQWRLTKEGREILENLKIINFIDDDLSSIELNIE